MKRGVLFVPPALEPFRDRIEDGIAASHALMADPNRQPRKAPIAPEFLPGPRPRPVSSRIAEQAHLLGTKSDVEVAQMLGCSGYAVYMERKRLGIPGHRVRHRKINAEKAQEMFRSGMSRAAIGEAFGATARGVLKAIKRAGFETAVPPQRKRLVDRERAATLFASGMRKAEIAREFGVSRQAIHNILRARRAQ